MTNTDISKEIAQKLGIPDWRWLYALIEFESRWNPTIKNPDPKASARGLIQFIDEVARELGYASSLDLVTRNSDVVTQMRGPVYQYLKRYAPFPTEHSLYLAVFYPKYRNQPASTVFPDSVQNVNPGIKTPADYVALVRKRSASFFDAVLPDEPAAPGTALALAIGAAAVYIFS